MIQLLQLSLSSDAATALLELSGHRQQPGQTTIFLVRFSMVFSIFGCRMMVSIFGWLLFWEFLHLFQPCRVCGIEAGHPTTKILFKKRDVRNCLSSMYSFDVSPLFIQFLGFSMFFTRDNYQATVHDRRVSSCGLAAFQWRGLRFWGQQLPTSLWNEMFSPRSDIFGTRIFHSKHFLVWHTDIVWYRHLLIPNDQLQLLLEALKRCCCYSAGEATHVASKGLVIISVQLQRLSLFYLVGGLEHFYFPIYWG